jgi:hypothetical protein
LKPKSIRPVAVAGGLAVKLTEPPPYLLTGRRNGDLPAVVLIFDQLAEAAGEPLKKELLRTAFTSICSRMIRKREYRFRTFSSEKARRGRQSSDSATS